MKSRIPVFGLSKKKIYIKPELKKIPLDDEEELINYCKNKPYDVEQLNHPIEDVLNPKRAK